MTSHYLSRCWPESLTHTCRTRGRWVYLSTISFTSENMIILFASVVDNKFHIFVWNWTNTMNIQSTLWILMAWCFSIQVSVATILSIHPCIFNCLWVHLITIALQVHQAATSMERIYSMEKTIQLDWKNTCFHWVTVKQLIACLHVKTVQQREWYRTLTEH